MGCATRWNEAERSWDCPCHGSRFTEVGEVLQGPAIAPLESPPPGGGS
jgi:Rieske Fe-S protein